MAKLKKNPLPSFHVDVEPLLAQNEPLKASDFEPATESQKEDFIKIRKSQSYWQDAFRRLRKNKIAMVAFFVIILLIIFAFIGPFFVDYKYSQQIRGSENLPPMAYSAAEQELIDSGEKVFPHVFGTDNLGRDILIRVMSGTRVSMTIGIVASLIVLVIGSLYGAISGYFGGRVDTIMMRITEMIYSIPDILIVLLLATTLKPAIDAFILKNPSHVMAKFLSSIGSSLIAIFICFALLYWVGMARIIRGQILQLKQQEYVVAARALGASSGSIIRKHLLPNCIGQIIVNTCLQIPSAIFLESFLSFLGNGVQAPMTSLGSMASDALSGMYTYTYRLVIPAIFLSVMILAFNLFGDGLRDALDPRLKK
ncbi:MAG TPA: ABC transporter permease [Candidatus Merdenecus merdavium]|nr:ABC transporter permease [Candidatus Merdenecus merdavium]